MKFKSLAQSFAISFADHKTMHRYQYYDNDLHSILYFAHHPVAPFLSQVTNHESNPRTYNPDGCIRTCEHEREKFISCPKYHVMYE